MNINYERRTSLTDICQPTDGNAVVGGPGVNDDVSLDEEEAEGLGVGLEGRQGFRHAIMFGTKEAVVLKQNRGMPVKNNYAVDVLCRTLLVW